MHNQLNFRGLYIHVPFCPIVCSYCDFAVMKAPERLHERWFKTIKEELRLRIHENSDFDTLYIGGGTPSMLSILMINELFEFLHKATDLTKIREITFEMNPENVSLDLLKCLKSNGVNRISIGVQTFDDLLLKKLGRPHNALTARSALDTISSFDIKKSIDVMFGLPGQKTSEFLQDLNEAIQYSPEHISFYGLTIESNTLFDQMLKKGNLFLPEELYNEMYNNGVALVEQNNLLRYEVSNFAQKGCESIHNSHYWTHTEYLGVGPGAHSYLLGKRSYGPRKFKNWEQWVGAGCIDSHMDSEIIAEKTLFNEMIWLGLRTVQGIDVENIFKRTGMYVDISVLNKWIQKGFIQMFDENKYQLKGEGWIFLDEICIDLVQI